MDWEVVEQQRKLGNDNRKNLFETQDEIDAKKDKILEETAVKLKQQVVDEEVFTIRWRVV